MHRMFFMFYFQKNVYPYIFSLPCTLQICSSSNHVLNTSYAQSICIFIYKWFLKFIVTAMYMALPAGLRLQLNQPSSFQPAQISLWGCGNESARAERGDEKGWRSRFRLAVRLDWSCRTAEPSLPISSEPNGVVVRLTVLIYSNRLTVLESTRTTHLSTGYHSSLIFYLLNSELRYYVLCQTIYHLNSRTSGL